MLAIVFPNIVMFSYVVVGKYMYIVKLRVRTVRNPETVKPLTKTPLQVHTYVVHYMLHSLPFRTMTSSMVSVEVKDHSVHNKRTFPEPVRKMGTLPFPLNERWS